MAGESYKVPSIYIKELDTRYSPIGHEHAIEDVAGLKTWKESIDLWRGTSTQGIVKCYIDPNGNDYELPKVQLTNSNLAEYKGKKYYVSLSPSGPFGNDLVEITELHLNYYIITNPDAYTSGEYGDGTYDHPFFSLNKACKYLSTFRSSGQINFEIVALITSTNYTFNYTVYQSLSHPDALGNGSNVDSGWLVLRAAYKSDPTSYIKNGGRAVFSFGFMDTINYNRWNAITIGGNSVYLRDIEIKCVGYNSEYSYYPSSITSQTISQRRNWWQRSIGLNLSSGALLYTDNVYISGFCCGAFLQDSSFVAFNKLYITALPIEKHQSGYNLECPPFDTYPVYTSDGRLESVDTFIGYSVGIDIGQNSIFQTSAYNKQDIRYEPSSTILIKNFYFGIRLTESKFTSWMPATGIDTTTNLPIFGTMIETIIVDCFMGVEVSNSIAQGLLPYWTDKNSTDAEMIYGPAWRLEYFGSENPEAGADTSKIYGHSFIKEGCSAYMSSMDDYYAYIKSAMPSRYVYYGLFQKGSELDTGYCDTALSNCTVDTDMSLTIDLQKMFTTNIDWTQYFSGVQTLVVSPSSATSYIY